MGWYGGGRVHSDAGVPLARREHSSLVHEFIQPSQHVPMISGLVSYLTEHLGGRGTWGHVIVRGGREGACDGEGGRGHVIVRREGHVIGECTEQAGLL